MSEAQSEIPIWPFLRHDAKRERWIVDARTKYGGARRVFETKKEALCWREQQLLNREDEGLHAFDERRLAQYGWTVRKAVDFALEHLERRANSVPLSTAIDEFLKAKRKEVGERRYVDLWNRLTRFAKVHGDQKISDLGPEEINKFLGQVPHPATRNGYRKDIRVLWTYCLGQKWTTEAINRMAVPKAKEPEKARKILSVEQAQRLMQASSDPEVRAINAMVLFGGVRVEEAEKLDWSAVNFTTGHIEISSEISKVSTERFSPMPDNLRDWLWPIRHQAGPIKTRRALTYAYRETWKRAGLYPWSPDTHRHSFISYRRQLIGDIQTALDGGTSETIIKRFYKRPVLKQDAERYFEIRPSDDLKKIVPIPVAAA